MEEFGLYSFIVFWAVAFFANALVLRSIAQGKEETVAFAGFRRSMLSFLLWAALFAPPLGYLFFWGGHDVEEAYRWAFGTAASMSILLFSFVFFEELFSLKMKAERWYFFLKNLWQ